ncbi:MAG: TraB/GumN family protein, partial [Hyphomonas sp.]|nr:TraB/GumN family protein [Hyphomonas sp.]
DDWVPKIETMLDTPGTMLVAVGAGHLAGKDSVIEQLRARGHDVSGP